MERGKFLVTSHLYSKKMKFWYCIAESCCEINPEIYLMGHNFYLIGLTVSCCVNSVLTDVWENSLFSSPGPRARAQARPLEQQQVGFCNLPDDAHFKTLFYINSVQVNYMRNWHHLSKITANVFRGGNYSPSCWFLMFYFPLNLMLILFFFP